MKKMLPMVFIFLVTILLAGCISIPLGDGEKLSIGFDGINIEEAVEENNGDNINTGEGEANMDDGNNLAEIEASAQDTEDTAIEDDSVVKNDEEQINDASCEDDYSLILDDMPTDFPMPACAIITSVNSSSSNIDAYYNVEGDWQDMYKLYQDYFSEHISSQSQKPEAKSGEMRSSTDKFDIFIQLNQKDDDFVSVRVLHYFVEETEEE